MSVLIEALEAERDRIESAISALRGGNGKRGGKRHMSAAARKKIGAAAKKRWAAQRKAQKQAQTAK